MGDIISMAHGNGGRLTQTLIHDVFQRHLANSFLDTSADAVCLPCADNIVVSTDSFTVDPLEFPGGDIGKLAVFGTVNDLAVAGARTTYMTLTAIIEEGFRISDLDRIIASLAQAANQTGVSVVAGDTKVIPRQPGKPSQLYLTSTGIGSRISGFEANIQNIKPGDKLIVSGPIGDHGIAVLLAREEFSISSEILSDCASVLPLAEVLLRFAGLRFMRDPTRGGLATVCHELRYHSGLGMRLEEDKIPVRSEVTTVCQMLGYDPYYLACEGRLVAVVSPQEASDALHALQEIPQAQDAAIIGTIENRDSAILLQTKYGGERILEELEDDPLPRIC